MIEKISKLNFEGGCFNKLAEIELFPGHLNLLYGRNGSGKSTIAKAIRCAKGETLDGYNSSFNVEVNESVKENIFVFDEDFVNHNVRIEESELGSIAMLGAQVDIDIQIKGKEKIIKELQNKYNQLNEKINYLENKHNNESPEHIFNSIKNNLIKDKGRAEINRKLKGNRTNSRITFDSLEQLYGISIDTSLNLTQLIKEFDATFSRFKKIKDGQEIYDRISVDDINWSVNDLQKLLTKELQKPTLSKRDREVIRVVQSINPRYLTETKQIFSNPKVKLCPLCLQEVKDDYRVDLLNKVREYFNKETEFYRDQCGKVIKSLETWNPTDIQESIKKILNKTDLAEYKSIILELKKSLSDLSRTFQKKLNNIYDQSPDFTWSNLQEGIEKYHNLIESINSKIENYNTDLREKDKIKDHLIELNREIAAFENKSLLKEFHLKKIELKNKKEEFQKIIDSIDDANKERSRLISEKSQVGIALNLINSYLSYIFFDRQHMCLKVDNNKYKILINNEEVKPNLISTGERNALALSYFFAKTFENKEEHNKYNDEMLIVLDDPVSSFDKNNKLGITSFLRWQISEIYKGNENSKILIMSHDLQVVFDIDKIFKEIRKNKRDSIIMELNDLTVSVIDIEKGGNEYKKLITDVFSFANSENEDGLQTIGNEMRKMLEAYSTLVYNEGFMQFLHQDETLERVPDEKKTFYKNLMTRLVLNSDSHTKEMTYDLDSFEKMFSKEEVKKTAKYILMFFYYINEGHLNAYLGRDNVAIIKKWVDENIDYLP